MQKSIYTPQHQALQQCLRQIRLTAQLSQAELAQRLDEPQSFVSKYESGERRLDLIELRQVCQACGASLDALVEQLEERLRGCDLIENSPTSPKRSGPTSARSAKKSDTRRG